MSKPPAIQSPGPAQNPAEKKDNAGPEERDREDNKPNSPSADFAALISAIAAEGQANRAEEKREDRGKAWRDWLTLAFVIATTGGVFYQAHIFSQQRDEMHTASEQTDQLIKNNAKLAQAATDQAAAAAKQAEATDKQATALGEAAKISHENMILAQRAWVGPTNAAFVAEPVVGKPIDINITYQNSGREPAQNFVFFGDPFSVSVEEDKSGAASLKIAPYMETCKATMDWKNGSVAYPSTGFSSYNLSAKSKEDFVDDATIKGEKIIFFQGCFLYRSFDLPRHSYFCYFYKQGMTKIQNLNICPGGHYAD
jgi:hypothetical protein